MAKREVVTLVDDLTGNDADETVAFSLDGVTYEIDLSADNAERLRSSLAEFVGGARRTSGRRKTTPATAAVRTVSPGKGGGTRNDPEQLRAVRSWAGRNGHTVSDRGRIPQSVMDAYHEANAS